MRECKLQSRLLIRWNQCYHAMLHGWRGIFPWKMFLYIARLDTNWFILPMQTMPPCLRTHGSTITFNNIGLLAETFKFNFVKKSNFKTEGVGKSLNDSENWIIFSTTRLPVNAVYSSATFLVRTQSRCFIDWLVEHWPAECTHNW